MAKTLNSFTLDIDIAQKLQEIENKSELINSLLKTYFGSANYGEDQKNKTQAKIEMLQKQLEREQNQVNKIIVEEKLQEREQEKLEQERIRHQENLAIEQENKKKQYAKDVEDLTKLLGREPNGKEIVEYRLRNFNK
jgi:hypothetical protein